MATADPAADHRAGDNPDSEYFDSIHGRALAVPIGAFSDRSPTIGASAKAIAWIKV